MLSVRKAGVLSVKVICTEGRGVICKEGRCVICKGYVQGRTECYLKRLYVRKEGALSLRKEEVLSLRNE